MFGKEKKVRYAVVGLGYIAQVAVLPGFKNAKNAELAAFVSDDAEKLKELTKEYKVEHTVSYGEYEQCLRSGLIDAVYIALPNSMHRDFAVKAAQAGIHVLCEKPMAIRKTECKEMIRAARNNKVKLMIAYRLHFDDANLRAVEIAHSGKIGEPRIFNSVFSQQVKDGDIRVQKALGGGTIEDMGIYCINAARYLFRDEPIAVTAFAGNNGERRFREIEEMMSCTLRFPGDKLATFTASFGASSAEYYSLTGTKGSIFMKPSYTYEKERVMTVTIDEKETQEKFPQHDQFGAELQYFSDCVLNDKEPEPNGDEGLADVRIIRALRESVRTGRSVQLPAFKRNARPDRSQEIKLPAVEEPELVNASGPDGSK